MNEALKPDAVRDAAPAIVEAPRPRGRRLVIRIALVVALAAAAVFAWQKFDNIAPSTNEGQNAGRSGPPPQTVRVGA